MRSPDQVLSSSGVGMVSAKTDDCWFVVVVARELGRPVSNVVRGWDVIRLLCAGLAPQKVVDSRLTDDDRW